VRPAVEAEGTLLMWRIAMKPGRPLAFGKVGAAAFIGLPGNPVSSLVNFYIFIKPAIDYLFHRNYLNNITAILQDNLKKKDSKLHFSRGILYEDNGEWKVTSKFTQSSGDLVEMSRANCLIVIEEERENPTKGEKVKCIRI